MHLEIVIICMFIYFHYYSIMVDFSQFLFIIIIIIIYCINFEHRRIIRIIISLLDDAFVANCILAFHRIHVNRVVE